MKSKIVQYNFSAEWVCGSTHKIPDGFSRAPISQPTIEDQQAETAIEKHVNLIIHQQFAVNSLQTTHHNDTRLDELRKIARDDSEYNTLRSCVKEGFRKNLNDIPSAAKQFWNLRDELSIEDELILYAVRIVVPRLARKDVLEQLHPAHHGIDCTKRRARQTVYWPAINNDITNTVCQL